MGVETLNDCVIFPHQANWKTLPKWNRLWQTRLSTATKGGEDRSTGAVKPLRSIEFSVTAFSIPDRARLEARILAALKSGRAVGPLWGRGQLLEPVAPAAVEFDGFTTVYNYRATDLTVGKLYYYERGKDDVSCGAGDQILWGSGYFIAPEDVSIIKSTVEGSHGQVIPTLQVPTSGAWPWGIGPGAYLTPAFTIGTGWIFTGLTIGKEYFYARGSNDVALHYTGAGALDLTIDESGSFIPQTTTCKIVVDDMTTPAKPGHVKPGPIEYAFFRTEFRAQDPNIGTENRDLVINCGGPGIDDVIIANQFGSGGADVDTGTDIDTTAILGFKALPMAVYQTAQNGNEQIQYVIPGWVAGVDARVRLHWAEIEGGFDGGTSRKMQATVQDQSVTVDPYNAFRELYKATAVDYIVKPDASGNITVTLTPLEGFAGINAIQIWQRNWELIPCATNTGPNDIFIWEPVKGVFQVGTNVYPALFGQLTVGRKAGPSPKIGEVRVTIAEPLGSGDIGISSCPVEVCIDDGILPITTSQVPVIPPVPLTCPGLGTWGDTFWVDPGSGRSYDMGVPPYAVRPDESLEPGVLERWAADVWQQWLDYKAANGVLVSQAQLSWYEVPAFSEFRWNPSAAFNHNSWNRSTGLSWKILVEYCPP